MWFWSQSLFLLTFSGFSLISQNPSRIHDFTWILAILCDFVADGRFCNYFSRFQPDLPEPLQNAWFYLDSCDIMRFCSQWFFLLTLPRFSLISQNPSRIHDFTWIPVILCDFVGNGCFCLLFQVSAWPNVKTHKNTYKVQQITLKTFKIILKSGANQLQINANQGHAFQCFSVRWFALICSWFAPRKSVQIKTRGHRNNT